MPIIPMSEAEEYAPVEPATYAAHLSEWEYVEESATSGEPFVKTTFIGDEGAAEGRKFWRNYSCQASALRYFKQALIAMGADAEVVGSDFDIEDVMPDLIGNDCKLVIGKKEFEGVEQNEVRRVLAA